MLIISCLHSDENCGHALDSPVSITFCDLLEFLCWGGDLRRDVFPAFISSFLCILLPSVSTIGASWANVALPFGGLLERGISFSQSSPLHFGGTPEEEVWFCISCPWSICF